MIAELTKNCFTAGYVEGFQLFFIYEEGETAPLKNPHGYKAEDIPSINSGEMLDDTSYFYVYFEYGEREDTLTTLEDAKKIIATSRQTGWSIMMSEDPQIGWYWKIMPENSCGRLWEGGDGKECVLEMANILCNKTPGLTHMHIQLINNGVKEIILLKIKKIMAPVIREFQIEDSMRKYNLGDDVVVSWTVPEHENFKIYFDGQQIAQNSDFYRMTAKAKWGEYVLKVVNDNMDEARAEVRCEIDCIQEFKIENAITGTDRDEISFSWKVNPRNVRRCSINFVAYDLETEGENRKFVIPKLSGDTEFTFCAEVKGGGEVEETILFPYPVIEEFSYVEGSSANRKSCQKRIRGNTVRGFLSPEMLRLHLKDPEMVLPYHVSCKGGGGTSYHHQYKWKGKNIETYTLKMKSGKIQKDIPATETGCTVITESSERGATLEAFNKYGYVATETIE